MSKQSSTECVLCGRTDRECVPVTGRTGVTQMMCGGERGCAGSVLERLQRTKIQVECESAIQAHIKQISRLRRHQLSVETMERLEGYVGDADQMPLIDFLTIALKGNKTGVSIAKSVMAQTAKKYRLTKHLRRKLDAKKK